MRGERTEKNIIIDLTSEEVCAVMEGKLVGERLGVTYPEAKVEVAPLDSYQDSNDQSTSDRYTDDRVSKAIHTPGLAFLMGNGDLQFFLPNIALRDVRVSGRNFTREQIQPLAETNPKLRDIIIPPGGVQIRFGGSLQRIDIVEYFHED